MQPAPTKAATTRLTFGAWLQLGLEALGEEGPEALTVEALCVRAKRTRGSFYHHFPTMDYFIKHMMESWQKTHTEDRIAATFTGKKIANQLSYLNQLATSLNMGIEQGVRRLAARDKTAAEICATVDKMRITYLASLYTQSSRYTAAEAETIAKIEYAAFVGMQTIFPDEPPARRLAMHDAFMTLIGYKKT